MPLHQAVELPTESKVCGDPQCLRYHQNNCCNVLQGQICHGSRTLQVQPDHALLISGIPEHLDFLLCLVGA